MSYRRFAAMIGVSTLVMYGLMYLKQAIDGKKFTPGPTDHDSNIVDKYRQRVVQFDHGVLVRDQERGVYQ